MAAGMAVVLYGVAQNDLARSLGGACLTMTALTLIALVSIRKWTTDTRAERARLADATREADTERSRSFAARAAMEVERERMGRDVASEREQLEARLKTERAAMRKELEEERARIVSETLEAAFRMIPGLVAEQKADGTVIGFPTQGQLARPRAEESHGRGHGRGVSQP